MATWVIPDEGKQIWLDRVFRNSNSPGENYHLRGFSNNYTPDDSTTAASFTESAFTGYAAVAYTPSGFPASTISSHVAQTTPANAVYSCTGATSETMYGVYLEGDTTGKILAAVRFDAPRTMNNGATETVTPELQFKTFV